MVRYLSLISFTDKGIRDVTKSLKRAGEFRCDVETKGGKVLSQYWALGEIDGVVVFECPDDNTAAALMLKLGKEDNVRTRTTRVFDAAEFENIACSVG
ncbi:MAG: GYD domain-containing protein [Planctomycetaceae bacterium]|nr:GYD domain-containing protein [Planctomycetaceae bacterium]